MTTKEKIGVTIGVIIFLSIFPIVAILTDTPWKELLEGFKTLGIVALCVFTLFLIIDLIAPLFGWNSTIIDLFEKPNEKRNIHKRS